MENVNNEIQRVADNNEKFNSFKMNFGRYNKAKKEKFYLECLWIIYAMLEDRSSAFLYYIGFTSEEKRQKVTCSRKIKKDIRQILNMQTEDKYKFDSISNKLGRIEQVIKWSNSDVEELTNYQKSLREAVGKLAKDEDFLDALCYLNKEWRDKRNQLIHALFNKKPEVVVSELSELVDKGYVAVRELDKAVSKLRRYKIREKYKIN